MASIDKELEEELLGAGNKLLDPPSSVDNLLDILIQIESCLSRVEQSPPESMLNALSPSLKALIADKLIKHSDADVKVALASCFSEITRITAPDAPYDDGQMKEVFRLIVSSFENLHDKSSRWYSKRTLILETVAKVRSCVVMLDLECDALILEMFQHFLKTIREHHPDNVFSSMETIMILCLEESEEISDDLLSPILDSVKKDNEEVLPIARKLGERVLESCATRLKPCLLQAVNTLGISLDDYGDVLASICKETSDNLAQNDVCATSGHVVHDRKSAEEPVEESAQVDSEITKEATPPQQDNAAGDRSPKSVMSNGIAQAGEDDTLDVSKSLEKQDGTDSPVLSKGNNLSGNDERDDMDTEKIDSKDPKLERSTIKKQDGTDSPVLSKGNNLSGNDERDDMDTEKIDSKEPKPERSVRRKGKKASSSKSTKPSKKSNVVSEKEAEKTADSKSSKKEVPISLNEDSVVEATGTSENDKEIKAKISSPKAGGLESDAAGSPSPSESNHDENRSKKRVRTKKNDSSAKEVAAEDISKKVSEGTSDSKVKPARPSAKKGPIRSSDVKTVVHAVMADVGSSSLKPEDKKKKTHVKGSSEKGLAKSSAEDEDKVTVSSLKSATKTTKDEHSEETPKTTLKRKRTPGKEKGSDTKKNDQSLVGKRVKVWWPDDNMFYKGVVDSFDSSTKKHKVLYDDGDEEILNFKEEKYEIVEVDADADPDEEGSHRASPEPSADMPLKKKGKTNAGESKKEVKKESSKSGGATSSKSKTPSAKSNQKSKVAGKSDGEVTKKSKDSAQKTGGKSEDRSVKSGGKSEDRSVKSGSKSVDSAQKNNSKKTDGSKTKKSKDDDVETPKPAAAAKSKQETLKSGKSKQGTPKIASSSKTKSTKSTAKVKFNLLQEEDSDNENSDDSSKEVEVAKVKTPSSSKAGSEVKSGKKRSRN
ncbi:triadin isoform X2 [Medicago truncatula]|uniref:triadin isoform X2 n=1 Tax=Medicago truncatula TaxID=3880 RepID=UPI001967672A|nr:triadin isoform X2 [Medicago truncatula]